MKRVIATVIASVAAAPVLAGCAALKLSDLEPAELQISCHPKGQAAPALSAGPIYVLPGRSRSPLTGEGAPPITTTNDFQAYSRTVDGLRTGMPEALRQDPVVTAVYRIMTKTSGAAQLHAYEFRGGNEALAAPQEAQVRSYGVPDHLTHAQLKAFAKAMFTANLRPAALPGDNAAPSAATTTDNTAALYLRAYYNGDYVDRYGTAVKKPELSTTVTDAQITTALSVLLDYVTDQIDPTPVIGDKDPVNGAPPDGVTFLPGKSTKAPTALTAKLATYRTLDKDCGLTKDNLSMLWALSGAAGDRAAALGGLVAETPGGLEIGLGVLGKISIGDNKTLSEMAKITASRLATRIVFASGYWGLTTY